MVFPLLIAAGLAAAGSVASGIIGANAAKDASNAQVEASKRATSAIESASQKAEGYTAPWLEGGKAAFEQYMGELGLSKTGAGGTPFQSQFTATPDYQFRVNEGEKGVVGNLNRLGMKNSGAALKALTRFREDIAGREYGSYLDRLSGVSSAGQQTAENTANRTVNSGANIANTLMSEGEARASGYVGSANAITGAIGNFTNNTGRALGKYDNSWNYVG